jgi:hypothetical protein
VMTYGFGYGPGRRGGAGFGFRGASPSGPYMGRGRGGLPRCSYYLGKRGPAVPGTTREEEFNSLKALSAELSRHLSDIDARIKDLEAKA